MNRSVEASKRRTALTAMIGIIVVLLFLCGAITGSNDTFEGESNAIPIDEPARPVDLEQEDTSFGNRTLNEIFREAERAYLDEDWGRCVDGFNAVLHGYKVYKRMVINCREKCRAKAAGDEPLFPENIEDLHFYEKKIRETLCLMTCNQEYRETVGAKALHTLPREVEQKLRDRRVYEYLHICYYKRHRYQDAANALFTFLVGHKDHSPSIETLKYYLRLPGVEEENVVNLETAPYVVKYFKGVSAYVNENYAEAVGLFESSLRSYLESVEQCRFYCESPFDQGWHPEFTSSIANHFVYCLNCKQSCTEILNDVNGNYHKDMLWSHYNYLQFSYYKLGKLKAACAAVGSYLLFDPVDETMLKNREYYIAQPKVKEEYFAPRQEALVYLKRREYEHNLVRYIAGEFSVIDKKLSAMRKKQEKKDAGKKLVPEMARHTAPGPSLSQTPLASNVSSIRGGKHEIKDIERQRVKSDVYLVAEATDLGGENRYVADGFLNSTECESLMRLATVAAVEGDGYSENKSPHSKYERFEGITIGRIALMVYFGQIEPEGLELLLQKTEEARSHVERYFGLDRPLYFTYTHLVCRTALPDSPKERNDLSHQIHADNCLQQDDNICLKESPAYVWRDYSAILYLNQDFQGGEFFFAKDHQTGEAEATVSPRCGRTVAFSAGGENLHGVRGVLRGTRCALALWFTQDERYLEYERVLAWAILERVRSIGSFEGKDVQVPLRYEDLLVQYANSDEFLAQFLTNFS